MGVYLAAEEALGIMEKLHINALFIAVVVLILAGAIIGAVKGLLKMIFAVIGIVLAITLTIAISPITRGKLMSNAKFYNYVYSKTEALAEKNNWAQVIATLLASKGETKEETGGEDSMKLLGELMETVGVPKKFSEAVVGDESVIANMAIESDADVNAQAESLQKGAYTGITNVIIKAAAFLLTLLIVGAVIALIGGMFSLIGKAPGVENVNKVAGAIAGGFIGLMAVWVLFAIITMLGATAFGQKMLAMVEENALLSFIYNHNFITARFLS